MIRSLLNATLTVYRASFTDDGRGGRTKAFASAGTIRAKLSQPAAEERAAAAQMGARLDYIVHTTHDADVRRGDELDSGGARRLRVVSVVSDSHATYRRLDCEVVQSD